MGEGGMDALVALGGGDMRRSLNILQSCHMAFDQVDEAAVYLCTGNPMPKDIQSIVQWLFNEPFQEAYEKISALQVGG
jgi:replication factor C subunit 3/5